MVLLLFVWIQDNYFSQLLGCLHKRLSMQGHSYKATKKSLSPGSDSTGADSPTTPLGCGQTQRLMDGRGTAVTLSQVMEQEQRRKSRLLVVLDQNFKSLNKSSVENAAGKSKVPRGKTRRNNTEVLCELGSQEYSGQKGQSKPLSCLISAESEKMWQAMFLVT